MTFADKYFSRYQSYPQLFDDFAAANLDAIVVIPCYDDIHIFKTLASLRDSIKEGINVEVIVIINSGMQTSAIIIENNRKIFEELKILETSGGYKFKLLVKNIENIPKKTAGVGNARKIGMDEAVRRFDSIEKPNGIIISLDADCLVDSNYLSKIITTFRTKNTTGVVTTQFKHDFNENLYSNEIIKACKLYEIYLRYFRISLRLTGFPYCFHTIGSCFAVTALSYIRVGGMSKRQGGEDFYFLHKLAPMTEILEIKHQIVFPSPRISDRVPFGTGPSVQNIINTGIYKVYNFKLFFILKEFYDNIKNLFIDAKTTASKLPHEIIEFIGEKKLLNIIDECKQNTKGSTNFIKRFYLNFDAFFIIKFLNSFDTNSSYPPQDIVEALGNFFQYTEISIENHEINTIYDEIVKLDLK
ncbi:glycosyltransferase family 2 protein [Bacteroidales bacterium OttesenSCG-928-I21]|nr:glycosyltransferase family 2 protein [Bacteroidales bacterium OttesenSCG-928-I21]